MVVLGVLELNQANLDGLGVESGNFGQFIKGFICL